MFKVSRLTDYGVVILRYLSENNEVSAMPSSARDLAQKSGLPLPTVSKLLKLMAKHKLIAAKRGALGGYELLENPKSISLLRLIEIFEGPPALTACMSSNGHRCQIDQSCPQRGRWQVVHRKIAQVLRTISLSELIKTTKPLPILPPGVF